MGLYVKLVIIKPKSFQNSFDKLSLPRTTMSHQFRRQQTRYKYTRAHATMRVAPTNSTKSSFTLLSVTSFARSQTSSSPCCSLIQTDIIRSKYVNQRCAQRVNIVVVKHLADVAAVLFVPGFSVCFHARLYLAEFSA